MTTPAAEDEFTELLDADFPRVDLVGKAANGIPRFLIAKQDGAAGLLEPEFVRDLITKAEPSDAGSDGQVTMTGTPAAIAKLIHGMHNAPVRASEAEQIRKAQAEYEQVIKAKYNAEDLKRMAGNGQAMKDESYPIGDEEDLGKAVKAVGRGGADHDAIRRHVIKRAKALGKSSMIPDNWAADGSLKEAVSKDMGPELDDGIDGMDPTVPLAAPGEEGPGDPKDPGSPAWEAIDAATAQKWTSIAVRLKNALAIMAEREMLEAASADPGDAGAAWDLQDAQCAVDYVIDTLACFAAGEQAEAELGAEAMEAIGKAMAGFDPVPLETIEGFARVAKAGRVLSAANEDRIRTAAASLQSVLQSLPAAPAAEEVTKEEAAMAGDKDEAAASVTKTASPDEQAASTGPVDAGGTTGMGEPRAAGPDSALPADGPQQARPGDMPGREVVKADGEKTPMMVVYNQAGKLVGIVDPSDITPVANSEAEPDDDMDGQDGDSQGDGDGAAAGAAPAADAASLAPQPPAEAGTPAEDVAKQDHGETITIAQDVLKSIVADAVAAALGAQAPAEDIAKQADVAGVSEEVAVLKARLATLEEQPAAPKVFTNGQTPPAHQLRGQDRTPQGGPVVDVAKAQELRGTLYRGTAPEQNQAAIDMQTMAIAQLTEIHARR